jgi:hypothetical protein
MKSYFLFFVLALSSCTTLQPIYNPENVETESLVKVTTLREAQLFSTKYNAWIERIWNEKGEEITKRSEIFDSLLAEFSLPPGIYKFKVSCVNGTYKGNPEAIFELSPNKNYRISCEIGKGENILGFSVDAYAGLKLTEVE